MVRIIIAVVALLTAFTAECLAEPVRRALVIGNDAYPNLPNERQLKRAKSDAAGVASALREIGFAVVHATDLNRLELNRKLAEFGDALQPNDIAALFFSGHGVEIEAQNYLLPSDIPLFVEGDEGLAAREAISLQSILDMLQKKGTRINLVILDACRDNPFTDGRGKNVGGSRGLAAVAAPTGTFIMFSAFPGEIAFDSLPGNDLSEYSVYTRHLLDALRTPNLPLTAMAKRLQEEVNQLAKSVGRRQVPDYDDKIIGQFVLLEKGLGEALANPVQQPPPRPVPQNGLGDEKEDPAGQPDLLTGEMAYLDCVSKDSPDCYEDFLGRFHKHPRAEQVRDLRQQKVELPLYQECVQASSYSDVLNACNRYLSAFPTGKFAEEARERLKRLALAPPSLPPVAPVEPNPPPVPAPREDSSPTESRQREFTSYDGYDLPGGDFGSPHQEVSYDRCQFLCAEDQQCVAFTYDRRNRWCFLKSQVTGLDSNPKAVSAVLAALSQPGNRQHEQRESQAERSFQTYDNQDVPGGDYRTIKKVGFGDCRSACAGDTSCVAFTFNRQHRWCFLKSSASGLKADGQATSGVLSSIDLDSSGPPGGAGMRLYHGTDFAGRDLDKKGVRPTSLEECKNICVSNPSCNAFSWVSKSRWCWPKSDVARPEHRPGIVSGRRL